MAKNDGQEHELNWKSLFDQKTYSKENIDAWVDSVVQKIWRPVAGGILIAIPAVYVISTFIVGKRFKTAAHIPPEAFERTMTIRGKVVSVGDSDNFRLYHTPGLGWGWFRHIPKTRKELQNQTIAVRIAGVDAPESAHFGMPAQPFSAEAKQFLTKMVLNKKVQVQLLSRDQYSRVVAMAYVRRPPFFLKKNVSLEMVKAGLASIYVAKGAQYAGILDELKKYEARAKLLRKGIWSLKNYVSPGDHKSK
ncbi:putative endonuclease lcl3 [Rhizopus azygosporus]|uniref:Putative endonuclease lcl3 n=1 Tax=Rhizopus azygosporus TaxID=86630 RepID=A0A367KFU0_RHIAZ|nr:putative endonuclease lcl3 [Rhizopus azygosporus]